MQVSVPGVETRFERQHGVHQFTTYDGMPVTGISVPTWEEFEATLDALPTTDGYIVSPELITSPVPLEQIAYMQDAVDNRSTWVRDMSRRHPWARIVLGTAVFDEWDVRPTNSTVAYMSGEEVGRYDKQGASWGEGEYLRIGFNSPSTGVFANQHHRQLICSDLISAAAYSGVAAGDDAHDSTISKRDKLIPANGQVAIVSSCWGVPPFSDMPAEETDKRCANVLEQSLAEIFRYRPYLVEVIMIDRAIPEVGIQPFNLHARRQAA